jgi:hypothetical protein
MFHCLSRLRQALGIGPCAYGGLGLGHPERAIAAASIDATVTNNKMRFIGTTLSLMGRRKGVRTSTRLANAGSLTRLARCGVSPN